MKNIDITIDDSKIKKIVKAAKSVFTQMKKDAKKLEKMGFDVNIQIETGEAVDKIVNDSIIVNG